MSGRLDILYATGSPVEESKWNVYIKDLWTKIHSVPKKRTIFPVAGVFRA